MTKPLPQLRPLPASLALVGMGVGAILLIGVLTLSLLPIVVAVGVFLAWVIGLLIFGWAGIEALAALERWFEQDPRFQR